MAKPAGSPTFVEKPFIRQDPECTRLQFECKVESETEPEITWFQNDSRVKPTATGRYKIEVKKLDEKTYHCFLDITDPDRKDAGKYQCKVKNSVGDCNATVFSYFG